MDLAVASGSSPASSNFQDGLGERRRSQDAAGEPIELLCLRRDLTSIPSFEFALRERTSRLAAFRHTYFGRVRSVDRLGDAASTLAVASDFTRGVRLSQLLTPTDKRPVTIDINAALHLIRQLVNAVAMLHENARDVAHGAIGPERVLVTANARVVIVEYVLGAALEQLRFSHERYWRELRVAAAPSATLPKFDQRTDITQIGVVALSLILGRLLTEDEFPDGMGDVLASASGLSAQGASEPLPHGIRTWLSRALQLDQRHSFESAIDAQTELDKVLSGEEEDESDYLSSETTSGQAELDSESIAETPDEDSFVAAPQAEAIVVEQRPEPIVVSRRQEPVEQAFVEPKTEAVVRKPESDFVWPKPEAAAHKPEPVVYKPEPVAHKAEPVAHKPAEPVAPKPEPAAPKPEPVAVAPQPKPVEIAPPVFAAPEPKAAVTPPAPEFKLPPLTPSVSFTSPNPAWTPPSVPVSATAPAWTPPAPSAHLDDDDDDGLREHLHTTQPKSGQKWTRIAVAAAALICVSLAGTVAFRRFYAAPVVASTGTLNVSTNPPGALVIVDNESRGATPLTLTLTPGAHVVELRGNGEPRKIPITITAGDQTSQYIELPSAPVTGGAGQLNVRTEPPGAKVTVDGVARGKSPVLVDSLAPGEHVVVLESDFGTVKHTVNVESAATASLVVPLTASEAGTVSGWVSLSAPVEVQIFENKRLLGTSQSDRLMVSAGRHELEIVNEPLGYRAVTVVQVPPGKVAPIKIEWPKGSVALNAVPWAEVWIDGEKLGETPIGNLSLPIGPHEAVFRHPELGEQRYPVSVSLKAPARVSVDMRKKP